MRSRYELRCVLWLCCPVDGPGCAVPGCAPAGTMLMPALRVLAEPTVVPARRAIASGCMCAQRVLAEPRVVCVRHKSNSLCCPVHEAICAVPDCAPSGTVCARRVLSEPRVVCVRHKSNSLRCPVRGPICVVPVALLPGLCAPDVCWSSIGLCAFDVNRTRDGISVHSSMCGTAGLPCV